MSAAGTGVRSLWVTTDFPPRPGGIEQLLDHLVAGLDPDATRVLAAPWPGDRAHDASRPWRTDRIGRRPLLPTPALAGLICRAAAEHRADVVVFGVAWPLGELADRVGRPTLALTMGHEAGLVRVGLRGLVRHMARKVDALGALSEFTRSELAPVVDPTPVRMVRPGVDVDVFHPGVDGAAVRARHGIPPDAPLVVCVSRLVPRKGQDALVAVWPAVQAAVPGAGLLLAGTGPLAERLASHVARLRLEQSVTLAGAVAWDDLPAYHASADVFAMPCRTRARGLDVEGLGIVYLEAQACGVPVVAGTSGGAPEAVIDGETGLVVDGRDHPALVAALVGLLRDPARRAAMGAAGRAHAVRRWAWPVVRRGLSEVLDELRPRP